MTADNRFFRSGRCSIVTQISLVPPQAKSYRRHEDVRKDWPTGSKSSVAAINIRFALALANAHFQRNELLGVKDRTYDCVMRKSTLGHAS